MRNAADSVHLVAASAGFLSYLLLWATVCWGALLGRGWAMTRFTYANVYAVHMTLALVAMTLGWGHAFTQLANPVGTVFLVDVFVPFVNGHDPIGIGLGVLATELMTALLISVPVQRALGYRRWRMLHSLAYASFTLMAGHVLFAGSDTDPPYVKIPVVALWASTVVLWLAVARWRRRDAAAHGTRSDADRQVEVHVDPGRCERFGYCEREAPDVFELREDGRLSYRMAVSGDDQIDAAVRAARVCPARAISMGVTGPGTSAGARGEVAGSRGEGGRSRGEGGRSRGEGGRSRGADEPLATVTELRRR
ncbi:ferredoxin [Planosporangium sp. 12N6]|uniref:ferredoxin n=1 Tax=Planosporangium spinosum TaxID=3402278 RepID=UPI003CF02AF8